jgi:phosphate transport system substrate-binding protein
MRKILYLLPFMALLVQGCGSGSKNNAGENKNVSDLKGTIIINGSEVLFPLAIKWEEEFNKQFPRIVIENKPTCSDNSLKLLKAGLIQIAMVSRKLTEQEANEGLYAVPVAMDAVLPVISFDNDNIQTIVQKGISPKKLAGVFNGTIKTWGQLLGNKSNDAIEVLILPDSSGTSHTWAEFLQMDVKKIHGTSMYSNQSLANTIASKKLGIGYCSMSNIYDPLTKERRSNIYVLPVDLNANGQADDNELVFDRLEDLKTAIQYRKYPSPPVRTLYLVTKNKPKDDAIKTFLIWILGIGQNYCEKSGLVNIDRKSTVTFLKELK